MATKTWDSLPVIGDGHPSNEARMIGWEDDDTPVYVDVPCGEWSGGSKQYCDDHHELFKDMYPQGWAYYPGDICTHGVYVGGSGRDLMCFACEMGDEEVA